MISHAGLLHWRIKKDLKICAIWDLGKKQCGYFSGSSWKLLTESELMCC